MLERLADHDPALLAEGAPRHRLWKVRAKRDRSRDRRDRAADRLRQQRPARRHAGYGGARLRGTLRRGAGPAGVVFTNNDDAYRTALSLQGAGIGVAARSSTSAPETASPLVDRGAQGRHRDLLRLCRRRRRDRLRRPDDRAREDCALPPGQGRVVSESGDRRATSSPCPAASTRPSICGATMAAAQVR